MRRILSLNLLALAALASASPAPASQTNAIVLRPGKEAKCAYICSCKPSVNTPSGGGEYMWQGIYNEGSFHNCAERFLLEWDLSSLPKGARIQSAIMELFCKEFHGQPAGRIVFARLTESWEKGAVTFNSQPAINEADRLQSGSWPAGNRWCAVDVTAWVKGWRAGDYPNHGLMGLCEGTDRTCSVWYYAAGSATSKLRPKLTVTIETPEPPRLNGSLAP